MKIYSNKRDEVTRENIGSWINEAKEKKKKEALKKKKRERERKKEWR